MTPQPKLVCRQVWKVFGGSAKAFLAANPSPTNAELAAAELVGAVRGIDLEVQEGEIFVIMGLSGSGKSTLVRCLSRLVEPTAGEILFNGENLLAADEKRMIEIRRHQMGMVFQHFALLPHLSVLDNVAFPLSIQGVERGKREARAREMIDLVGLTGREHFYPRQLSGGQQQRVGIARSLAVEPELWFLDEPFSALDPLIRREMQDEFVRLQSVLKKTIVFITHDLDEALRLGDQIAILRDGEVIQQGTSQDIVLRPADDYIAAFAREVNRGRVLHVETVMTPINGMAPRSTVTVPAGTSLEAAARILAQANENHVVVVDGMRKPIGQISLRQVASAMVAPGAVSEEQASEEVPVETAPVS
jgi:glycine betaine/proline transport system ATP-binding protein